MSRTHDNEKKPSQSAFSFKPTASFLQTRGFAPLQTDLDEDAPRRSGYTENLLEKIINQRGTESADTPVQAKPMNRLMKPLQSKRMAIQAKLSIGEPNDKYEKEADATASKVVQQINSPIQEQSVQREAMEEEDEELQMKSLVQRRGDIDGGEASTDLESSIQSARGSGQSLDSNLQAKMGQAMGADFSGVKIHTDSQSDRLNKSIQAKAFTTGQDVFFRQGEYNPSSKNGQELIAHELTHVVQQNGGAVQRSPQISIEQATGRATQVQRTFKYSGKTYSKKKLPSIEDVNLWLKGDLKFLKMDSKTVFEALQLLAKQDGKPAEMDASTLGGKIIEIAKSQQPKVSDKSEVWEDDDLSEDEFGIERNTNSSQAVVKGNKGGEFIGDPSAYHIHLKKPHWKYGTDKSSRKNFYGEGQSYDQEKMKIARDACESYEPQKRASTEGKEECLKWFNENLK
ncbi:DUF4157 domain-containing protein [Pseudanabaena sp. 'Roaring Creek']|uniref:eCIS core domain-containing protein n=1 Tax=Pseudanabaena sp. 'Roaring Creek' TaxID=1681830 RepID=UPI0006D81343|nr:DUF4157 domain-containing protein [Pseudanabaena sp. 'Roaring Creek']